MVGAGCKPNGCHQPRATPWDAVALNKTFGIFEPYGSKMPRAWGA